VSRSKVVYTAITEGYDTLKPPATIDDDLDYVVFTDDLCLSAMPPWRPVLIETKRRNARVTTRWHKLLPHHHLEQYERSLWIDASFTIVGSISRLIDDLGSRGKLALFPHPQRTCIYDEAEVVKALGYERAEIVDLQMACYRARGFPRGIGLCESGVIYRAHHDPEVRLVMEDWWRQVEVFSQRDQLSSSFVFWKHGIDYARIPGNARSNEWLQWQERGQVHAQFKGEEELDELDWLRNTAAQLWTDRQRDSRRDQARGGGVPSLGRAPAEAGDGSALNAIASRYDANDGTRKARSYFVEYERLFHGIRDLRLRILELGVFSGASLLVWRDYLPHATIVGIDTSEIPQRLIGEGRIHVVRGSQDDPATLDEAGKIAGGAFDVIIDDASHIGYLTKRALCYLFPRWLKPGGHYVIEDIGTAFLPEYPDSATYVDPPWDDAAPDARLFKSHQLGMVGVVKQLIDYTMTELMTGTRPALDIERLTILTNIAIVTRASTPYLATPLPMPGPRASPDRTT
jgi:hypothetical protein